MAEKERTPRPPTTLGPAGEVLRENLKRIRKDERRLTFAELSKRLGALGRPIPVLGLRRIELGERRVDVDDLLALADALGIAPVLLLAPLGHQEREEVLPGREMETWAAVKWFAGRDRPLANDWTQSDVPTQLWEKHDEHLSEWQEAPSKALEAVRSGVGTVESAEGAAQWLRVLNEKTLRIIRSRMRELGLTPPSLPPGLKHIDVAQEADT
jgi:transcriptional regulator with XRE-family HTH domain